MTGDQAETRIQRSWSAATEDPTFALWFMVIMGLTGVVSSWLLSLPAYAGFFVIVTTVTTIMAVWRTRDNYLELQRGGSSV